MPDAPWSWSLDPAADGSLVLRLSGSWRMQDHLPSAAEVETKIGARSSARQLAFDTREVSAWDTGLLVFVLKVIEAGTPRGITADRAGLPEGVRKLLDLAAAVPERDTKRGGADQPFLARVGRARFRRVDLVLNIQEAGVSALGIVSLISFLIGLILAFVGAIQLRQFGAMMAAIIMAAPPR